METVNDPLHDGICLTMVTVTNAGRRPVTITNIGLSYLQGKGAILADMVPRVPCELTEGKFITAFVDEEGLRFEEIRQFWACDAVGHKYKYQFTPWHKRAVWAVRRSFKWFGK
jgi:hypothetical protein